MNIRTNKISIPTKESKAKESFFKLFLKSLFAIQLLFFYVCAKPNTADKTDLELNRYAIDSHKEFWTLCAESSGFQTENTAFYQYSVASGANGLNYVFLEKGFKEDDKVISKFGPKGFTIFFDETDTEHIEKYITRFKDAGYFVTQAYDINNYKAKPFPANIKVEKVKTLEEFEQWMTVTASRRKDTKVHGIYAYFRKYGPTNPNSPMVFYTGYLDGKPVGTSVLYKSKDFASLYWVGVHPDYRRKGLGSALSFVPTEDAKALGYRWMAHQAMPLGVEVYKSLGYKDVGRLKLFFRQYGR